MSHLPLAHAYDSILCLLASKNGGKIAFYSGDYKNFTSDCRAAKPFILHAVPRVWEMIEKEIKELIAKMPED